MIQATTELGDALWTEEQTFETQCGIASAGIIPVVYDDTATYTINITG